MIHDPILSEKDGWFYLSYTDVHPSWDDSLGSGSCQCHAKFATSTERFYFIEFDKLTNEIGRLNQELHWLKTIKGANRNLREVRREAKGIVERNVLADIEAKLNEPSGSVDISGTKFGTFIVESFVPGVGSKQKSNGNRWLTKCLDCGYSKWFRRGDIVRMQDGRASVFQCPRCANK